MICNKVKDSSRSRRKQSFSHDFHCEPHGNSKLNIVVPQLETKDLRFVLYVYGIVSYHRAIPSIFINNFGTVGYYEFFQNTSKLPWPDVTSQEATWGVAFRLFF